MGRMKNDSISEFGTYAPSDIVKFLIRVGQVTPNFLGQQFAQIVRRYLIRSGSIPLDIEVEGLNFRFYLSDNASEYKFAFMPWRFDKKERNFIKQRLREDGIFIDIGANIGIYTLTAAKYLGKGGKIISFEPNPEAYERLRYNISCRSKESLYPDIEALNIGLSSKQENISLYLDEGNLGAGTILQTDSSQRTAVTIKCCPLLSILEEKNIAEIDFLKIDIEGAEDKVLAPFFIQAPEQLFPKNIIIENSQQMWNVNLYEILTTYGYRIVFKTKMNTVFHLT